MLERKLSALLTQLQSHTGKIDLSALEFWLIRKQDEVANKIKYVHEKKVCKLEMFPLFVGLNVDKISFNYSNWVLTALQNKILLLGLESFRH